MNEFVETATPNMELFLSKISVSFVFFKSLYNQAGIDLVGFMLRNQTLLFI